MRLLRAALAAKPMALATTVNKSVPRTIYYRNVTHAHGFAVFPQTDCAHSSSNAKRTTNPLRLIAMLRGKVGTYWDNSLVTVSVLCVTC